MADNLGLKIVDRGLFTYHRRTIAVRCDRGFQFWAEFIAHELGHFFVAPKYRRYWTNFGLAGDPEYPLRGLAYKHVGERTARKEEAAASILGIHILYQVGLRQLARSVWDDHGWGTHDWREARHLLRPYIQQVNSHLREAR